MQSSSDSELFAACNHTELYQICRRLGMNIPPYTPSDFMRAYIVGDEEIPAAPGHQIDSLREAIMSFLSDHWQVVRAQVQCPAKNLKDEAIEPGKKRACFNCTDARVLSCIASNPENEDLILMRRKVSE